MAFRKTFFLVLIVSPENPFFVVLWFVGVQLVGGFMLGLVFILNHSGRPVRDLVEKLNFFEAQAGTTRNVDAGPISDWFTGGLNRQLEHHFFPNMPRHRLKKASAETREILERFEYAYDSLPFFTTCKVVRNGLPDGKLR